MIWYWFLLSLVFPHKFNIPSRYVTKTTSTLNPPLNSITTAAAKQDTFLRLILDYFSTFHSSYHISRRDLTNLPVIIKYCFFITPILRFYPLISFPNQGPLMVHSIAVKILPSLHYIVSSIPRSPPTYKLAQAFGPLIFKSHYRCSACLLFLKNNLRVLHAKRIPTSCTIG